MFLTRLLLNERAAEVRRDLANVHDMHRRIMTAFPDEGIGAGARQKHAVLYRVETFEDTARVLVQSATLPDWSKLPGKYLQDSFEPNPAHTDLGVQLRRIEAGERLRFRLRANATKKERAAERTQQGKRVELVGFDASLKWLLRKGEQCGFAVVKNSSHSANDAPGAPDLAPSLRVRITEEPKARGHRGGKRLSFGSALFDGELVVTDAAAFSNGVAHGIGTGKAYGFGMMSVGRI